MLCLEVDVNGEKSVVAGDPSAHEITARVMLCPQIREHFLTVSGDVFPEGQPPADARWFTQKLAVGDRVSIRLIESDDPQPAKIVRGDPSVEASDDIPWACSFCGKPSHEVERLLRGKKAMICNECIEFMHETEIQDRKQEQMLDSTDDA